MSVFRPKPPSAEDLQQRRDILHARCVPETLIERLATRKECVFTRKAGSAISWISILAAARSGTWLFAIYENYLSAHIVGLADRAGAILFHYSERQGFALVALIISPMGFPLWAINLCIIRPKPYPAPDSTATTLRTMSGRERNENTVKIIPGRLQNSTLSEEAFLLYYNVRSMRLFTLLLFIPLCIAAAIFWAGHDTYWAVRQNEFRFHGFGQMVTYGPKDIIRVSVGCNQASDTSRLEYEIHFRDNTLNLSDGDDHLTSPELFTRLAAVNESLRAQGTKFVRWKWLAQDPMAPKCIAHWADQAGSGGLAKLKAVLAVP